MEKFSTDFSLEHHISGEEFLAAEGKLARVKWLHDRVDKSGLYFLQDGPFSRYLLHEITSCFVNGQFVAVIVLGFSFIERTIAGRLHFNGETKLAKSKSETLLAAARDAGWLTVSEHEALEDLRKLRNPIVHFKEPVNVGRPEIRATNESKQPYELLENDAEVFLSAVINLLNKTAI